MRMCFGEAAVWLLENSLLKSGIYWQLQIRRYIAEHVSIMVFEKALKVFSCRRSCRSVRKVACPEHRLPFSRLML